MKHIIKLTLVLMLFLTIVIFSGTALATNGYQLIGVGQVQMQYMLNDRLALRAGYNYAKAPIDEADVFNNLIFPAYVERHVTCGFDYQLGDHWGIGGAYKKAFKETATGKGDVPAGFVAMTPFTADSGARVSLEEDSIGLLISYRFK